MKVESFMRQPFLISYGLAVKMPVLPDNFHFPIRYMMQSLLFPMSGHMEQQQPDNRHFPNTYEIQEQL